jgi:hypothetical protein
MRGAGRGSVLAAIAVLALLAVGAAIFFGSREREARIGASPNAQPHDAAPPEAPAFEGRVELGTGPSGPAQYPTDLPLELRFEGTGKLTVYAFAKDGAPFPEHWLLALEPSQVLVAGKHARGRRLSFDQGEREVALEDLELGGYDLRAFANGLCAQAQQVLLAKPDDDNLVVHVVFFPAGFLTGRVVDSNGAPVADVGVVLESAESHERREGQTDPAGVYLFETVLDGEYTLFVGEPINPLTRGRELAFAAPSLHMADIEVPVLGDIAIQVVDRAGRAVAGARIEGYGIAGGRVALVSDEQGRALARHLPPGDATLVASTDDGNQGREKLTLAAGARAEITLRLRK